MELLNLFSECVEGIDGSPLYPGPGGLPISNRVRDPELAERADAPVLSAAMLEQSVSHISNVAQTIYGVVNTVG